MLIFALLATILPSLLLGYLSYLQSSKLLREKISHEMHNATMQASGKLDVWFKDRLYDLRVFSNSYIISENLGALFGNDRSTIHALAARAHIKEYLKSVGNKFKVYEELILIDRMGTPLVASSDMLSTAPPPKIWLKHLQADLPKDSKSHYPAHVGRGAMFIAETIRASDGTTLGILAAKVDLTAISTILKLQTFGGIDELYLLNAAGRLLVSSSNSASGPLRRIKHVPEHPPIYPFHPNKPTDYISYHDRAVVGTAIPISFMEWIMVAEMEKKNAYAEITVLRRVTITLVSVLILCIGIPSYIFGHRLVDPVQRLSKEAARVASGNLDVTVPVLGLSEVSYLTQVFNHMVTRLKDNREDLSSANNNLRESNEELHQISITDDLTGLHNRKHIMEILGRETARSGRSHHNLSVLMLDIDYFKKVNDTYGHQVGDTVIGRLARTLSESVRECDHVGRYGGEEFMIILPDSDAENAISTAERIRKNVSNLQFIEGRETFSVTISIGVAGYPEDGEDAQSIVGRADSALYQAKDEGRNRVVVTSEELHTDGATVHVLPRPLLGISRS